MILTANLFSQIFSLLSLFFIISLSIIVLRNSRHLVNKLFFLLTIVLDLWIFGSFMMINSTTNEQIIFWDRFVYAAIVFWPALQYHFSLSVTYTNRLRQLLLKAAYLFSLIFLFLSQTDLFATDVFYYAWGAHTKAEPLHHVFMFVFVIYIVLFLSILIKKFKSESNLLEKKRTAYYILGFIVLNFIGGTAFLPAYLIPFYPFFLATPLIFSLIITYAIVYFGLMDIKIIIRRYLVYLFSLIFVIMPSYAVIAYVYIFYPQFLSSTFILTFLIAVTFFPKAKRYFYRFSNKYLFSSLYDFNELIYNLNNRLRSSLDISQVFKSTTDLLLQSFHSKSIAVIYYEPKLKYWIALYNVGFHFHTNKIELDYKAISNIFTDNRPLDLFRLKYDDRKVDHEIAHYFKELKAELIVPISIEQKKISSLMIFGSKESEEVYNSRDLKVLESIAAEIGISLENALLYQNVTKFNIKLKDEIYKATKKLQEQNETLKQLDKAKTEFIGIASHQLRTPLTGVRWLAELLLQNKDKNLNDKQLNFLNQLIASNQRMIRLVSDLLDVSHIETGMKFEITKDNFWVNKIIQEVLKENVFLITTKNLIFKNKIPASLKIIADREKIKQVWQNLISNATKYSNNDSKIELSFSTDNKRLIFCVKNQGIGIPKEQQDKIFSKFFRARNASLQHSDGTGLGLYIAKEIMKSHNGDIWFESDSEKGTSFYFSLPIIIEEQKTNKNNKIKTINQKLIK